MEYKKYIQSSVAQNQSIHPSIFCHICGTGSWEQQSEQRSQVIQLQFIFRDIKVHPSQPADDLSSESWVCHEASIGYVWKHISERPSLGGVQKASKPDGKTASSGSFGCEGASTLFLAHVWCLSSSTCLTGWAQITFGGSSLLVFVILFFQSPPTERSHRWGLECSALQLSSLFTAIDRHSINIPADAAPSSLSISHFLLTPIMKKTTRSSPLEAATHCQPRLGNPPWLTSKFQFSS